MNLTVTDMDYATGYIFDSIEHSMYDLCEVVVASMSYPVVFTPVTIHDRSERFSDGGIAKNFAIDIHGQGTDVIGFKAYLDAASTYEPYKGFTGYLMRIIEVMMDSISKESIEDAPLAEVVELYDASKTMDLSMDEDEIRRLIKTGYRQAKKH